MTLCSGIPSTCPHCLEVRAVAAEARAEQAIRERDEARATYETSHSSRLHAERRLEEVIRERDGYRNGQEQMQEMALGLMDSNAAWARDAKALTARADKAEAERDEARKKLVGYIEGHQNLHIERTIIMGVMTNVRAERDELAAALRDMREAADMVLADAGVTVSWPHTVLAALAKIGSNDE